MDKTDALAIINVTALEDLKIDDDRRLTIPEKTNLFAIIRRAFMNKREIARARAAEIRTAVINQERNKSEWKMRKRRITKIEDQLTALKARLEDEKERLERETGFDSDGDLASLTYRLDYQHVVTNKEVERITKKINLAIVEVESIETKFDKIEAKLLLCSTYGDARKVMDAVLGNGDTILGQ